MLIKPKKLSNGILSNEEIKEDAKHCFQYGPAGVGSKAVYLNSFYMSRHYYIPFGNVKRVFKRLAVAKGRVQACIPYLVVIYDNNVEKQCIFKLEQDVDAMLTKIKEVAPKVAIGKN